MSAVYLDPPKRNGAQHRPLSAMLLAAMLTVAAVSGLCSAVPALSRASTQQPASVLQCARIVAGDARLACYDHLGHAALDAPAKGANAPSLGR
jgi:hypothetical protein